MSSSRFSRKSGGPRRRKRFTGKIAFTAPSRKYKKNKNGKRFKKKKKTLCKVDLCQINKDVKRLKREADVNIGTRVYRSRATSRSLCTVNTKVSTGMDGWTISNLEDIVNDLEVLDDAAPGTLKTIDLTSGIYSRKMLFTKCHVKFVMTNNYQVPVLVNAGIYRVKKDTSTSALDAFDDGILDVTNALVGQSNPLIYPSDSPNLRALYKCVASVKKKLMPGQSATMTFYMDPFIYDTSLSDEHTDNFQAKYGCNSAIISTQGVLGHDTTLNQQGYLEGGVDIERHNVYELKYDAGIDIHRITVNDLADTFTNAGVVSNRPVVDNQSRAIS